MHEGALKRKSSDRNSRKFKKSTNCENQGNPLNQEPTIATSALNSFQMPLCSDASEQAMKIYIKSEPVSNLYLTTQNTSSNIPQTSKVVISPGNILTQATPKNEGQKFMISTKPVNNGRFTSSLNISTNSVPSRPLILPLTNHASTVIGNNEGHSTPSKSSNKPLMGSIGGPKTPIIPAATPFPALGGYPLLEVNQSYDPNNHEWGTATKRKQRMIKNRESACQSR
uniref:BZIP domain-containing protein n=1 Tax=Ciona savignyi TaxID=51511 RepID=H2YS79_CIOSA